MHEVARNSALGKFQTENKNDFYDSSVFDDLHVGNLIISAWWCNWFGRSMVGVRFRVWA